jgi:hypothetical protein
MEVVCFKRRKSTRIHGIISQKKVTAVRTSGLTFALSDFGEQYAHIKGLLCTVCGKQWQVNLLYEDGKSF